MDLRCVICLFDRLVEMNLRPSWMPSWVKIIVQNSSSHNSWLKEDTLNESFNCAVLLGKYGNKLNLTTCEWEDKETEMRENTLIQEKQNNLHRCMEQASIKIVRELSNE